jgi:hypothetical protein
VVRVQDSLRREKIWAEIGALASLGSYRGHVQTSLWVPSVTSLLCDIQGDADVLFQTSKKRYVINVPTPIMIALGVLFEAHELGEEAQADNFVTFSQLCEKTHLPRKLLQAAMYSLACEKYPSVTRLLVVKEPSSKIVSDDDKFRINMSFEASMTKIRIPMRKYTEK